VKLWHGILLIIGALMVVGGSLALILQIDNPKYAPGEACAMVERVYHWYENSGYPYGDLYEEYLGEGIWEVKSSIISSYVDGAVFRVYEATDTVEIVNTVARLILTEPPTSTPYTGGEVITDEMLEAFGK